METNSKPKLEFYGGRKMAFLPLVIFVVTAVLCFIVWKVFDMEALAAGAFVGMIVTALFAKDWGAYWGAAQRGLGNSVSTLMVLIFFVIGIFSRLMAKSDIAQGFVWIGDMLGIRGGIFTAFTFVACCVITTAIGSSIGTTFSCFPIFFPSGVLLGANPAMLAGAIISGAVFGDNLAPVSDTTIASAFTQTYTRRNGSADIAGVVSTRLKYSLSAGAAATILFAVLGGGGTIGDGAEDILQENMNPRGLAMLLPVVLLLVVAIKTRDVFKSILVGIFTGTFVALLFGLITPADILHVEDGVMSGYIFEGVKNMMATVTFTMSLFAITGILEEAGAMSMIVDTFKKGRLSKTPRGTELSIGLVTVIGTMLTGGNAGASVVMFGPIVDKVGKSQKLHPYRRANLLDGYANSLPIIVPFLSAFIFIGKMIIDGLRDSYTFIPEVNPLQIAGGLLHPMFLFVVLTISIATGWGRQFEGPGGIPLKEKPTE